VTELEGYKNLSGSAVTSSPAFKDNMLSYGVCYGLCVQGLGYGRLSTNLLPPEIVNDRIIRAKKPWAVAAVALLLLGCTFGYFARWREWNSARIDVAYQQAFNDAKRTSDAVKMAQDEFATASQNYDSVHQVGNSLADIGQRRIVWAELLKAINECLPKDEKPPDNISERNIIYVDAIDCERKADVNEWKTAAQQLIPADEKLRRPKRARLLELKGLRRHQQATRLRRLHHRPPSRPRLLRRQQAPRATICSWGAEMPGGL